MLDLLKDSSAVKSKLHEVLCCVQALAEFEMYRQRMEDSQLCTEAQHTQRVVSMSREVTHTHKYKKHTYNNMQMQKKSKLDSVLGGGDASRLRGETSLLQLLPGSV